MNHIHCLGHLDPVQCTGLAAQHRQIGREHDSQALSARVPGSTFCYFHFGEQSGLPRVELSNSSDSTEVRELTCGSMEMQTTAYNCKSV